MITHTIVYVILSVLSATAAYAASIPVVKAPKEQQQSDGEQRDSTDTL